MMLDIQKILGEIEEKENVKIILAVESGSRAYGIDSPDSDYDVRFIYVRNAIEYLKLDEGKDVIEWQLDDTFDINGWDIKKVLKLLYKSNASVFEWAASPIIYKITPEFERLKELLPQYFSRKRLVFHYYKLARNNYKRYLQKDVVKAKEYFYVIRSILAAKCIIDKGTIPPMKFIELEFDSEIKEDIDKLLKMKRETSNMGTIAQIESIHKWVESELDYIESAANSMESDYYDWNALNDYFSGILLNQISK